MAVMHVVARDGKTSGGGEAWERSVVGFRQPPSRGLTVTGVTLLGSGSSTEAGSVLGCMQPVVRGGADPGSKQIFTAKNTMNHGDPRRKTGSGATRARAMTAGLCGYGVMNFEPAADHGQTRAKAPRAKRHSFYHVNSGKPRFLAEPDHGHFLPSRCGRSQLVITPWRSVVLRVLRGKNLLACRRSNAPVPAGVPPRPVSRPENV